MSWLVPALLGVIVVLLALILWSLNRMLEWLSELTRASGQANVRELQNLAVKLDAIEGHTARTAQPFYEADEDRRMHPERYDADL